MIKEQWLCNVRFTSIQANIDLREVTVNARTGDFNATSLAHIINTPSVNNLVVQTWLDRAASRRSTLVFCVNLAHVRDLTNAFREAGIDARYVHSGTPSAERRDLITAFRASQFPVLLNCAILTEGTDIPNIDCVVVAKPTRSRNIFAQMIGRGMRLSPDTGKEDCHIIDFVDSVGRVAGVVSTPHLFGLDPSEVIDDESLEELEERADKAIDLVTMRSTSDTKQTVPEPKSVTYIDYEDPFALVHQASGAPHIQKLSANAWVGCGGDVYVLECLGKGFVRIEPAEDEDEPELRYKALFIPTLNLPAHVTRSLKLSPFQRRKQILLAANLHDAVQGCDTHVKSQILKGSLSLGILRTARWRREPASATQKAFVLKRWEKRLAAETDSQKQNLARLTKGEAANMITRLKHGAQARYEKRAKAQLKVATALKKEQLRRAKEYVAVGPLAA